MSRESKFQDGTVVGVLFFVIVYRAKRVPHRKYRRKQMKGRLKNGKRCCIPVTRKGYARQKMYTRSGKNDLPPLLVVVYTGYVLKIRHQRKRRARFQRISACSPRTCGA